MSSNHPVTVAWISDFPIEWLTDIPVELRHLPRQHPATWAMVLLAELETHPLVRIHVIVLRKNIARSVVFERRGVTFHVLKYLGGTRSASLFWVDTLLIRRTLRRIRPDLVHAWGNERGSGIVASRLEYPCLLTVQGLLGDIAEHSKVSTSPAQRLLIWLEHRALSRARHVSAESGFAISYLRRKYPHLSLCQIEHAPSRIFHDVERDPRIRPLRLVSIGTVGPGKGTDILLAALERLVADVSFELVLIGAANEALRASLHAGMSAELRARVTFKSDLSPAEVAAELRIATIFVLATRVDNSPNAIKEAAVAGVPIVATRVGGIPDHVTPDGNGVLCTPDSVDALAEALRRAFSDPRFSIGQVPPESLAQTRARLSPARMGDRFLDAYLAVCGRTSASTSPRAIP